MTHELRSRIDAWFLEKNGFRLKQESKVTGNADLRSFVDRLERIQDEIDVLNVDKKAVRTEIKAAGFDLAMVAEMLRLRKKFRDKPTQLELFEETRSTYLNELGMGGLHRGIVAGRVSVSVRHAEPSALDPDEPTEVEEAV